MPLPCLYAGCCLLQIIVSLFCQKHHPKEIFLANQYQNVDKIIIIWELASSLPHGVFVFNLFVFFCFLFFGFWFFLSETSVGRSGDALVIDIPIKSVCMLVFHAKSRVWRGFKADIGKSNHLLWENEIHSTSSGEQNARMWVVTDSLEEFKNSAWQFLF